MKFEVVEDPGAWIVRRNGEEIARFREQDEALADVAQRLGERRGAGEQAYSFTMRYLERG